MTDLPQWILQKLNAGFFQDIADVMETCKEHLDEVDPNRIARVLESESSDIRRQFVELWNNARVEIAGEYRLGQGKKANYRHLDWTWQSWL
jgi:hypothetical protein